MKNLLCLIILLSCSLSVSARQDICLNCHKESPPEDQKAAQIVDMQVLSQSVHADVACVDCHHASGLSSHRGDRTVYCGSCHAEEAKSYSLSPHVEGLTVSADAIPTCVSCHGGHEIMPVKDPQSPTNHRNSVAICTACHTSSKVRDEFGEGPDTLMIRAYEHSIHGHALLIDNNDSAPACVDCHGSHSTLPSDEPDSPLHKPHIAETCGKCHDEIAATYAESTHGVFLAKGVEESPTCTDCHGEHNIRAHDDPESRVYATNVSKTCSDCHESETVVAKYGLKADRLETFQESFHGIGVEFEDTRVANCASCHGVHNIFPQSDSRSTINAANIESTCGVCHDDLPADFAQGTVHKSAADPESGGQFWVYKFYWWFIPILILLFVGYRVLEYRRRIKRVE